ncbi:MAG: hypothetical protein WCC00_13995 [Candidatus Aminicenantales bacterium]
MSIIAKRPDGRKFGSPHFADHYLVPRRDAGRLQPTCRNPAFDDRLDDGIGTVGRELEVELERPDVVGTPDDIHLEGRSALHGWDGPSLNI